MSEERAVNLGDHRSSLTSRGIARLLVAVSAAAASATGVMAHAPASADRDVIDVVGLGHASTFGALGPLLAAPFALLPVGTRALRAGLASAVLAGLLAALVFELARATTRSVLARTSLVGASDEGALKSRLVDAVSAAAALTALLAPAVQAEARLPGGAVPGAILLVVAVLLALDASVTLPACALVLGLAAGEGPLVLVAVLAVLARPALRAERSDVGRASMALAIGLAPLGLHALARLRTPALVLDEPFVAAFAPWSDAVGARAALGFFRRETFTVVLAAVAAGAIVAARARAWVALAPLLVGLGVSVLGALLGDLGPVRAGPLTLAALLVLHAIAAIGLAAAPLWLARAPVPFAAASAALVVVLELVLPVRAFDEASLRRADAEPAGAAVWSDEALSDVAPGALVVLRDRALGQRLAAAQATGLLRGDVALVPLHTPRSPVATRALAQNPELAPLFRDVLLGAPPEELSFARAAQARSLAVVFEPSWDRSVARHLVPAGLFARFDPEPRGASDRRAALEAFTPSRERLAKVASRAADPTLARLTATLLRSRSLAIATTGDREALSRALDDLRAFAPEDPVAAQLVRRIVTTRGPIDVKDLALAP